MDNLYSTLVFTILGGLIWLIRLEAKVLSVERDIHRVEEATEKSDVAFQNKVEKLHNDLNDIKIALARIESRMALPNRANNNERE